MRLFYYLDDASRYVYHYTKSSTLLEYILPSGKLRLGPFCNTNDPREYKDWTFGFGTQSDFSGGFRHTEVGVQASELMKRTCKLLCTTLDGAASTNRESIDNIYERGFCRSSMWAYYAERHTGACLVFDRIKLDDYIRAAVGGEGRIFCAPVVYKNRTRAPRLGQPDAFMLDYDAIRSLGLERAVELHLSVFYKELFLEKSADWVHEREYRWLVHSPSDSAYYVSFRDSLVGILIGDNFPKESEGRIHRLLTGTNIPVAIMNWKSGVPEVLPSSPATAHAAATIPALR